MRGQSKSFRGRGRGRSSGRGSPSVPSFPVVSRSKAVDSTSPQDEDDAPPMAVSARRTESHDVEVAVSRGRGRGGALGPESTLRGRGRGRGEGRGRVSKHVNQGPMRGRGRGRGGKQDLPRSQSPTTMPVEEAEPHPSKKREPTNIITTTTNTGTELPMKLNSKIFIDGLPYDYKPEPHQPSLEEELFSFVTAWKVGKPLRLIKRPGQGFGFLLFKSPNSVPVAVQVLNGRKFLGRALRVEVPKPKDQGTEATEPSARDAGKDSYHRQVLLTDLAKVAEPDIIREVLRDVAPQLEGKLETIKMTSKNRKAFLTFTSPEDVAPAVNFLNGFHLLGRKVTAAPAAAPGSLPYSRTAPRVDASPVGEKTAAVQRSEDPLSGLLVPLGAEIPSSGAPTRQGATLPPADVGRDASHTTGSNRTGVTEKYNLLDDGPKEIYIGNVGENVTVSQLRQHFSHCGKIVSCELLVNPETHLLTGVAKMVFSLPAYAAYAKEHCHGSVLKGNVLHVERGEEPNVSLAAAAEESEEDDYDEDEFLRRHGVKDKVKYFKGTSVGAEMGITQDAGDSDDDDDDDEDYNTTEGTEFSVVSADHKKRPRNDKKSDLAKKKAKADLDFILSDSEEEHFDDVDEDNTLVSEVTTSTKTKKSKSKKEKKSSPLTKNKKVNKKRSK